MTTGFPALRARRACAGVLMAVALGLIALPPAEAIEWQNTAGGDFGTGSNWVGGVAPGSTNSAEFGANATFQAASQPIGITFGGSVTNTALSVQDASWIFNLGTHTYTLSTSVAVGALRLDDSVAGTAILNLSNGTLSTVSSVLGNATGTSGTVNVSGAGATFTNSSFVQVGATGTGALNILNGGVASGTALDLGVFASSATGTVTVSGTGSKWTGSDFLRVGNTGSGSLTIGAGGSVSDTSWSAGGPQPGSITVTGAGSTWTNSSFGGVESATGQSSLQILSGGVASGTNVDVAVTTGRSGSMTVDGTGSKWTG